MQKRIEFLDVFRFLMVSAALFSHVLGRFDTWEALSITQMQTLRFFTRGATPGLLSLFGFMIEYVYVRYAQRSGLGYSAKRMIYRALLCYLALFLVAVAGTVGLQTGLKELIASLLLVAPTVNGDVFALYLYMLFALIPLVALRLRFGIGSLAVVIGGIWLIDMFLLSPVNRRLGNILYTLNLHHLAGFWLGLGDALGPSIFHGFTAVLFGMVLGNVFARRSVGSFVFLGLLTGAATLIVAREIVVIGWPTFLANIADYDAYRAHNSLVYFAYGALFTLALVGLAYSLNLLISQPVRDFATYLGSRTFIYFLIGNILLNLVPNMYRTTSLWLSAAELLGLIALCYGLIRMWEARVSLWQPVVRLQYTFRHTAESLVQLLRRLTLLAGRRQVSRRH